MDPGARLQHFAAALKQYRGDPVGFVRNVLEVEPHPGQSRWLQGSTSTENALVTGNRWGKSYIAAAKRIYKCAYRIGWDREMRALMDARRQPYRSCNISITADQSQLVWFKAFGLLQSRKASWLVRKVKMTPFPTIEFQNGAVLEARSTARDGVYLLGHDYDDVNWDEAAYEKKFAYVRDNVVRMRLIDRAGGLDYTTTGNGRNEFGQYFLTGLPGARKDKRLYSQTGTTYENPFIDQERLKETAAKLSERSRAQNVEGAIVDAGGDFFTTTDLDAIVDADLNDVCYTLFDDEDQPAYVELRFPQGREHDQPWRLKYPSHRYVHGWDLADKRDWCVGTTFDVSTSPKTLVEFERFNKKGWAFVYSRIRERHRRYNGSTYVDTTGLGDVVVENLSDIGASGINFAGGRKDELLTNLQTAVQLREIRWPMIKPLYDEFAFYQRDDENLIQDCVMSCAVAAWFMRKAGAPTPVGVYVRGRGV